MDLQHEPAVGVADLVRIGATAYAENLVGFVDRHRPPAGRRFRAAARLRSAVAAAPFGAVHAVEIGFEQLGGLRIVDPAVAQQRKQLLVAELLDQPAAERDPPARCP